MVELVSFEQAKLNPVPYWLMACYVYEECEVDLMTDATFDKLWRYMEKNWAVLDEHRHDYLLDRKCLSSSIGATRPRGQWPLVIFHAAHHILDNRYGKGQWGSPGYSYVRAIEYAWKKLDLI